VKKWGIIGLVAVTAIASASIASAATKLTLIVNGKVSTAEVKSIDGVTYVPLRAAGELLGANVQYDGATKTITITSEGGAKTTVGKGIGSLQTFGGLAITLNAVEYKTEASFEPKNDQFVVVDLSIQNTTDKAVNVSTLLQMKLQDADGYKHSPALYIDGKGSLDGEVAAGDTIRGQVAFDVKKSTEYKYIFSGVLNGQVNWTFKQ
jgi:hypothetical protein